ncbi:TPA: DUF1461 domain-containing protein [Candidatus Woesearchaeota archaeon]|nr:DUF1461 domain-containing protein [Candidatus Woesearchaeota archaeon]
MKKNNRTDKNNVYIIYAVVIILILNMPILLLLNSFRFAAFDLNWYEKEFIKVGSYEFGYSKEIIDGNAKYLVNYLKYDDSNDPPKIELFENEENVHLLEVKTIMQKALLLADLTLFVFVFGNLLLYLFLCKSDESYSYEDIKYLAKMLKYGGIFTVALIGAILLLLKLDFSSTFTVFHKILAFDKWQFPYTSNMIRMFPGEFFYDIGIRIFLWTMIEAACLTLIGFITRHFINLSSKTKTIKY